jgi:hypothetical protein
MPIERIISGGQTGVDRAALDAAVRWAIPCGGWCPRGRRAEDGPIPDRYPLKETPSARYPQRTEWNVRDSDATLIVTRGRPRGGTALTRWLAQKLGRPCLVLDLTGPQEPAAGRAWLAARPIRILNVAGPRESEAPGIRDEAFALLLRILAPSAAEP